MINGRRKKKFAYMKDEKKKMIMRMEKIMSLNKAKGHVYMRMVKVNKAYK